MTGLELLGFIVFMLAFIPYSYLLVRVAAMAYFKSRWLHMRKILSSPTGGGAANGPGGVLKDL